MTVMTCPREYALSETIPPTTALNYASPDEIDRQKGVS
jgi:hypothetical protein